MNSTLASGLALAASAPMIAAAIARWRCGNNGTIALHHRASIQRGYDLTTLAAGALVLLDGYSNIQWWHRSGPQGPVGAMTLLGVAGLLGATLPLTCWYIAGRRPVRRPARPDCWLLPWAAASEELVWRWAWPALLIGWGVPGGLAVLCVSLGFLSLHLYRTTRMRGLFYLGLVTALLWVVMLTAGLAPAILTHVAHNLVLARWRPTSALLRRQHSPVTVPSTKEW